MTYCIDIDGTLCTNTEGRYQDAKPHARRIAKVNRLYALGHRIILFTARGSTTGIDWTRVTRRQLSAWKVKYHELRFGKPTADFYIDDKAVNARDWKDGRPFCKGRG